MKSIASLFIIVVLAVAAMGQNGGSTLMTGTQAQTISGPKTIGETGALLSNPGAKVTLGGTSPLLWGLTSDAYPHDVWLTGTTAASFSMDAWGTNHGLIVHSSGLNGAAIVAFSESGSPGVIAVQKGHHTAPVIHALRESMPGCEPATAPTFVVSASYETSDSIPLAQIKHCTALSGDNSILFWRDGSIDTPETGKLYVGGLNPSPGVFQRGVIYLDPQNRGLIGTDGTTQMLTWSGSSVVVPNLTVSGTLVLGNDLTITGRTSQITGDLYAERTVNSGSLNNTTALTNDNVLVLPLEANRTYIIECCVRVNGSMASGAKMALAYTGTLATPYGDWSNWMEHKMSAYGYASPTTAIVEDLYNYSQGGTSAASLVFRKRGLVRTSTAGNLVVQFAQYTATADASFISAGSWVSAKIQ